MYMYSTRKRTVNTATPSTCTITVYNIMSFWIISNHICTCLQFIQLNDLTLGYFGTLALSLSLTHYAYSNWLYKLTLEHFRASVLIYTCTLVLVIQRSHKHSCTHSQVPVVNTSISRTLVQVHLPSPQVTFLALSTIALTWIKCQPFASVYNTYQ